MNQEHANRAIRRIRIWPALVLLTLLLVARYMVPFFAPEAFAYGVMGSMAASLLIIVWWLFFSRAPWSERLGAIALMAVAVVITSKLVHVSIATGAMGMLLIIQMIPPLCASFVIWAWASGKLNHSMRWLSMGATILIACGVWTLVRTAGFTGSGDSDFAFRWSQTAEDRLLAETDSQPAHNATATLSPDTEIEWSGFRGRERDSIVLGSLIKSDWTKSPPTEIWRQPVGPGWSSFAVRGDFFFTQEQRGDDEVVSCYSVTSGDPVWRHSDETRFWESNAGAGPRGTPTIHGDLVISFGATGILNVLAASDGTLVWSRDAVADTGAKLPTWGFSSSPLVVDDLVILAASGALIAYDLASGEIRWSGPKGGTSYSSPQLFTIADVSQVLQLNGDGLCSVSPDDGSTLWQHSWEGYPIVQPAITDEGDILISVDAESGTRRLAITQQESQWQVQEQWTSKQLKSYFNDFVVHKGHAYGFDGRIMACIDLADGKRRWKGGRYGNGQLILLADQDLMLVLSESGDLALVSATSQSFDELAKVEAINGKTWNHPVLADDILLVRNAQEMAAFKLATSGGSGLAQTN